VRILLEARKEILVGLRSWRLAVLSTIHLVLTVLVPRLGIYSFEDYGLWTNWVFAIILMMLLGVGVAWEKTQGYMVVPMVLGKRCKHMIVARFLVYGTTLLLLCFLSMLLN